MPTETRSPLLSAFVERARNSSHDVRGSFLRSLIPVTGTYVLCAVGIAISGSPVLAETENNVPVLLGALIALLFTVSHAVVPVFIYSVFMAASEVAHRAPGPFRYFFSGFIYLHMGFWYGLPMLALGFVTGWWNLPWALVHVAVARRGTRNWVFLEYGSTSLALLLFVFLFSGDHLFPMGLIVAVLQALLLTILDWKARPLWVREAVPTT